MRSRSPPRSGGLLQLDGRTHRVSCRGLNLKKLVNCWKLWGFQVFLSNHNIASFHWKILRRETLKYWAPGGELQGKFDKGLDFFTFFLKHWQRICGLMWNFWSLMQNVHQFRIFESPPTILQSPRPRIIWFSHNCKLATLIEYSVVSGNQKNFFQIKNSK